MNSTILHIANANGKLNDKLELIKSDFEKAKKLTQELLAAKEIDAIVVDAPDLAIKELGVGGYTPTAHLVYINLDADFEIQEGEIFSALLHEIHHAMRWRSPGYGETLRQSLVTEGLACLMEYEITKKIPIYCQGEVTEEIINRSGIKTKLDSKNYNHHQFFITGNDQIPGWFGYALGFKIALSASNYHKKSAAEMCHLPVEDFEKGYRDLGLPWPNSRKN